MDIVIMVIATISGWFRYLWRLRWKVFLVAVLLVVVAGAQRAYSMTNIDVLVVYPTTIADKYLRTPEQVKAYAETPFPFSNEVFKNSGLDAQLRLVGTYEVDYVEKGGYADLTCLQTKKCMPTVHAERDRVGADLVVMLSTIPSSGGYTNVNGEFAVVSSGLYVLPYTLLHEVYHMMGGYHDVQNEKDPNVLHPNGHAYGDPARTYFTVGYAQGPTGTIPYFSSATRKYKGKPLGNAQADAEAVFHKTIPKVAVYRSPPVIVPVAQPGGC